VVSVRRSPRWSISWAISCTSVENSSAGCIPDSNVILPPCERPFAGAILSEKLVCVGYFIKSCRMNKDVGDDRDSASTLIVLSGMLAALAILIPLGATLLPERRFAWAAWLLVGTLFSAALCMFGTIFSMIGLQHTATFKPNASPYIPSWINATWFALFLLALSSVAVKSFPATGQESAESTKSTAQVRFVVARELPELGTSRQLIETK
jgi:hypothetical protein